MSENKKPYSPTTAVLMIIAGVLMIASKLIDMDKPFSTFDTIKVVFGVASIGFGVYSLAVKKQL